MRVESQPCGTSTFATARASRPGKTGSFQDALVARTAERKQDTLTISNTAVQMEPTEINLHQPSNATILPTDSVQVKLEKLQKIAETADYTGMSYGEVSAAIWKRYDEAFDGNMAAITSYLAGGQGWGDINNQYWNEFNKVVYHPICRQIKSETGLLPGDKGFDEYERASFGDYRAAMLGYGGMSTEEIEQAIYEKYAGGNTLYDFASMQGELWRSGVLDEKMGKAGTFHYTTMLSRKISNAYCTKPLDGSAYISDQEWAGIIDRPFDSRRFVLGVKESLKNMEFENWDFDIRGVLDRELDDLLTALVS